MNGQQSVVDHLMKVREWMEVDIKPFFGYYEPRRVCSPPDYPSSKLIPPLLYNAALQYRNALKRGVPTLEITALSMVNQILSTGVPTYYISDAFARAVANTALPGDFLIEEMKFPAPGFVLNFPSKFMLEEFGVDLGCVCCADLPIGEYDPPGGMNVITPSTKVPINKFCFYFASWNPCSNAVSLFLGAYEKQNSVLDAIYKGEYIDYWKLAAAEQQVKDSARLNKVAALIFKLLVILNIRGDLIEQSTCTRPEKHKRGKVRDALFSPAWIGRKYKLYKQGATPDGTHASPGVHTRRAHLAWQFTGKKGEPFISATAIPRLLDGSIDWSKVTQDDRQLFLQTHKRAWIQRQVIGLNE